MVTSIINNGYNQNSQIPLKKEFELETIKLFGTDGIRGKVGELLTPKLALQVGLAVGYVWRNMYRKGVVIIGQDSRNSSDMLAMGMASGLTAMGLEVWNLGLCPTPCVAYLTRNSDAIGGIMISASHNPPEDNGIKFFSNQGIKLNKTVTDEIEELLKNHWQDDHYLGLKTTITCGKHHFKPNLTQEYSQFLQSSIPESVNFEGMRIVLDLAWGASVQIAPLVFEALGAEVITLHNQADGDQINVNCGSTNLQTLQIAVKEYQADMGFAFDGDADRVMAVDNQGRKVCGDYILYLWGKYLQEQGLLPDNLLISTVMANLGFELAWNALGGQLFRTPVGDQYVQAKMWETGAMLGGEQSGHILCHHHNVSGDGIQTALQLTALIRHYGQSLADLIENSFTTYPQLLQNVRVENPAIRLNWQQCEPLMMAIAKAELAMGKQGRVLVRASGTEPLIRVMVEAQNEDLVNYWTNNLVKTVENYLL